MKVADVRTVCKWNDRPATSTRIFAVHMTPRISSSSVKSKRPLSREYHSGHSSLYQRSRKLGSIVATMSTGFWLTDAGSPCRNAYRRQHWPLSESRGRRGSDRPRSPRHGARAENGNLLGHGSPGFLRAMSAPRQTERRSGDLDHPFRINCALTGAQAD